MIQNNECMYMMVVYVMYTYLYFLRDELLYFHTNVTELHF